MLWQMSSRPLLFLSALPGTVYDFVLGLLFPIASYSISIKYLCVAQALEEMRSAHKSNIVIPHYCPHNIGTRFLERVVEDWRVLALVFGSRAVTRGVP